MLPLRVIIWTAVGQGLAAIGVLLGQRLITGLVTPTTYGEIAMLVGVAGLAVNLLGTPLVQAAIHQFPSCVDSRAEVLLKKTLSAELFRLMRYMLIAAVVLGCAAAWLGWFDVHVIAVIALLVIADSWRAAALALTNVAQEHRYYALWVVADVWLRALLAVVAVLWIDASMLAVIVAYLLAAIFLSPLSQRTLPLVRHRSLAGGDEMRSKLWRYAMPLVPLGLIGWVTGLADRYVIGATLSVADAGIYAAAAGLASRPILMLGTAIELIVRPKYQQAVSGANIPQAGRLLRAWLTAVLGVGGLLVAGLAYWRHEITALLLGVEFRSGAKLLPWIASGYLLLIASYVFERVCYAHGRTQRVLSIQMTTATAAVGSLFAGAYCFGLTGAALAVPVYYSVQLLASIRYAWLTQRERLFGFQEQHG